MKTIKMILLSSIVMVITSCSSNESTDDIEPSPMAQLAKTWGVDVVLINGQVDISTDYGSYRFTFNADGTYIFNDPDPRTGTWELVNSGSSILLDDVERYDLIVLEDNELIFSRRVPATLKSDEATARFELSPR